MRKYSQLDLLGKELDKLNDRTIYDKSISFILTHSKYVRVNIRVPKKLMFRCNIFLEDISELIEEEYSLNSLLACLYDEFIERHIREPLGNLYDRLMVYDYRTPEFIKNSPFKRNIDFVEKEFRVRRDIALRGEVFLKDLEQLYPNHSFTLEYMIEMILIDFLKNIDERGGSHEAINELLKIID